MVLVGFGRFFVVLSGSWQFLVVFGQSLAVLIGSCFFFADSWALLVIFPGSWWVLVVLKDC